VSDALLLCELHAHTTWSDGVFTVSELVDLYGALGFDVLCITDHVVRADDPIPRSVTVDDWHAYAYELDREAIRARRTYDLLLVPGLELSDNREEPNDSAHALALGLRRHVPVEEGIVDAIREARAAGAAIVAAHPYDTGDVTPMRATRRFALERETFAPLVDRWELFNRREVFAWVASQGFPGIATGDVHDERHVSSWKTLIPTVKDEEAVVAYLRSAGRAYLTPFAGETIAAAAVAA
jgi:predicted metal-dependent phosphoesterase TrpH